MEDKYSSGTTFRSYFGVKMEVEQLTEVAYKLTDQEI